MENVHAPVKRIVPGARCAALFIHGIVGTPRMFDEWAEQVPADWSLHNLLLPGHGGTAADFGRASMAQWREHVRHALHELRATHDQVYIMAHSMGSLLAIREAVRDDAQIAGMLLLCVPLRIFPEPIAMLRKLPKGLGVGDSGAPLYTYYGIAPEWRVWRYIRWIPRYLELFRESRAARRDVKRLTVPATALMAQRDELVSLRSERDMVDVPCVTVMRLPDARHYEYPPQAREIIARCLQAWFKE